MSQTRAHSRAKFSLPHGARWIPYIAYAHARIPTAPRVSATRSAAQLRARRGLAKPERSAGISIRSGREERWFELREEERWPDQIMVPFCWESLAAWGEADAAGNDHYYSTRVYRNPLEVTSENYRSAARFEIGWYRRTFTIPPNDHWRDKRIILTVGAADFFTEAWCHGHYLGRHEGGYTPFEFDVTDALSNEDGVRRGAIVLRVEDPMDNFDQSVGKQWGWYSSVSGVWQTVFLEPRASESIERFEITTDIAAATAQFRIFTRGGRQVSLGITSPSGERSAADAPVVEGVAECTVWLGQAQLWDPTAPRLYAVELALQGEQGARDVVHSYFGMRNQ